jgi:hypothetical protein
MDRIEIHLWVAALLQWLIASSNIFAARIFAYREDIARLAPFERNAPNLNAGTRSGELVGWKQPLGS